MSAFKSLRYLLRGPGVRFKTPESVRTRYQTLLESPVIPTDDGARLGGGQMWRAGRLRVLHLVGDRFEMAYQHGRLLRSEIADGSLVAASRITSNAIRNSVGEGALSKALTWYAHGAIGDPMLRAGLETSAQREPNVDALAEAYGLSEGSGVSVETIIRAVLGPETAQTLLGTTEPIAVGSDPAQCTSFAAWGDKTADGSIVIGRNTDYPLNGFYDRHPTVIYFEPSDGEHRYMAVTSAGFHNAGVCGMNDAGIYLACHTVPSTSVSPSGMPLFMVGQYALREASTFEEVEAILMDSRTAAGWNYHVVSTHEQRIATFEICADRVHRFDPTGSSHVTTNHWRNPLMATGHLCVNKTVDADTRARMKRAFECIDAAGGELDVAAAIGILGDKHDGMTGERRMVTNTVAATTTVSSSVWAPAENRVYVATGSAPVSRSTYVALPTPDAFDRSSFDPSSLEAIEGPHDALDDVEQIFIRAKSAFEYDDDADTATTLLQQAVAQLPDDPSLSLVLGMMAFRAGRIGVARAALRTTSEGADHRRAYVAKYILGRIAAADGAHAEAIGYLAEVLDAEDTKLVAAARRAHKKVSAKRTLAFGRNDLSPMMYMADAFRYDALAPWR